MDEPAYRRVVVKLSGEYLAGSQPFGIDQPTIDRIAGDLISARELGVEIAVVIGGGNIFRGVEVSSRGVSRPTGDTMGMLATVMNCLALEAALERRGQSARALSAFVMPEVCELFTRQCDAQISLGRPYCSARRRDRQPLFHDRHHSGASRGRDRRASRAQGDERGWCLQFRSEERPVCQTV